MRSPLSGKGHTFESCRVRQNGWCKECRLRRDRGGQDLRAEVSFGWIEQELFSIFDLFTWADGFSPASLADGPEA